MAFVIIPLYNAEEVDFRFNINPPLRFEKWNRQIRHVAMTEEGPEDIPDAVAIFEDEIDYHNALQNLEKLGLSILPVIFEKAYYAYSVADENFVLIHHSTTFVRFKRGWHWIRPEKLQDFLDQALTSYFRHNLDLILKVRYEADFMSSSIEVKFHLHWMILEILSKTFCETRRDSPISRNTIEKMIALAEGELTANTLINGEERNQRLNLVRQNLNNRLIQKSHRDLLSEFLSVKCHLRLESDMIKKIVELHGKLMKTASFNFSDEELSLFPLVDNVSRLAIIICLINFDEEFSKYLAIQTFKGPKLFDWIL
jgi:hypothetical protein